MISQNEALIRLEERHLIEAHIRKGQLRENLGESQQALDIWLNALQQSREMVAEGRAVLVQELQSLQLLRTTNDASQDDRDIEVGVSDQDSRVASRKLQLRVALELEHICTFFAANAYYQIKTDEALTQPESEEYKVMEKAETEFYEKARQIRQEVSHNALNGKNG